MVKIWNFTIIKDFFADNYLKSDDHIYDTIYIKHVVLNKVFSTSLDD